VAHALAQLTVTKKTFEAVKSWNPRVDHKIASKFIFLNRTAFAGLYRVNRNGQFNVPFGCKPSTRLPNQQELFDWSAKLSTADLRCCDFEEILATIRTRYFVYLDPPYTVRHINGSFRRYNERLFSWEDQKRLAASATNCAKLGAKIVVSNANSAEVRKLYPKKLFDVVELRRVSNLAANPAFRGHCSELIICSREIELRGGRLLELRAKHPKIVRKVRA
jgi:DNA adenine methylase